MGRRRKEPSLSDVLLDSPWWVSAALAVGAYIVFRWALPASFASNPFLAGIVMMSQSLAWVPATMFAFLGLLSFIRERRQNNSNAGEGPQLRTQRSSVRQPRQARPTPSEPRQRASAADKSTASQRPVSLAEKPEFNGWTLDALKILEWKRFELLCVGYYEAMGFTVKTVPHGPDGGIDATLYKAGLDAPVAVVQCKAWSKPVKVVEVRALAGVMHEHKVRRGVFWSLSGYVGRPVQESAERAGIQLLDGPAIIERIRALDQHKQTMLLAQAFEGDYRTPTCAACGVKMVEREGKAVPFWGCINYPACRVRLPRAV
ncbi:MAG: DNA topoisomerase [Cupriavidus sp.]|nr:DNA topoisomerase [Cupriavidus pauculus]MBU67382.1 DNA topoisomerase [Cupriavidus sp.]UAK99958.1 restriction endonuclease [Cupriavidus pauculus]